MPRRTLATLALLVVLAGCLQPPPEPAAVETAQASVEIDEARPDTTFGDVATGPAAAPDVNATTAEAPRLIAGEWWRIQFHSPFFADTPEVVRVVAAVVPKAVDEASGPSSAVEPAGYLIGMPHEGWYKEAIAYHAPAFGDVGLDLSYDTHNERFEPLRFPLVEGATWETTFAMAPITAVVESADEHVATIRFDPKPGEPSPTDAVFAALNPLGEMPSMRLTYDARQHEVVAFESAIGTWEVVEHGYGFQGWVTVPRGIHTAIDYGQFLTATPGEPVVTRTLEVEGGFNRLTLMHGIYSMGPGTFRIRDVAPDGSEYVSEATPTGAGFLVSFHEATAPDGTWTAEDVVVGAGGTYTMGMAYHQFDVRLPDGARRSDHDHPVVR